MNEYTVTHHSNVSAGCSLDGILAAHSVYKAASARGVATRLRRHWTPHERPALLSRGPKWVSCVVFHPAVCTIVVVPWKLSLTNVTDSVLRFKPGYRYGSQVQVYDLRLFVQHLFRTENIFLDCSKYVRVTFWSACREHILQQASTHVCGWVKNEEHLSEFIGTKLSTYA